MLMLSAVLPYGILPSLVEIGLFLRRLRPIYCFWRHFRSDDVTSGLMTSPMIRLYYPQWSLMRSCQVWWNSENLFDSDGQFTVSGGTSGSMTSLPVWWRQHWYAHVICIDPLWDLAKFGGNRTISLTLMDNLLFWGALPVWWRHFRFDDVTIDTLISSTVIPYGI